MIKNIAKKAGCYVLGYALALAGTLGPTYTIGTIGEKHPTLSMFLSGMEFGFCATGFTRLCDRGDAIKIK